MKGIKYNNKLLLDDWYYFNCQCVGIDIEEVLL